MCLFIIKVDVYTANNETYLYPKIGKHPSKTHVKKCWSFYLTSGVLIPEPGLGKNSVITLMPLMLPTVCFTDLGTFNLTAVIRF